jgi:hypothetical protein
MGLWRSKLEADAPEMHRSAGGMLEAIPTHVTERTLRHAVLAAHADRKTVRRPLKVLALVAEPVLRRWFRLGRSR